MRRLLLACLLCACDAEPHLTPRDVPVPTGTNEASIADMRDAVFAMEACLVSQAALPAAADLEINVLEPADGDDQQRFRVTLTSHAHEDSVDCLREVFLAWKAGS